MAAKTAKVAISMPKELFRSVEQVRRELKIPRSEAIVEAIRAWLKRREEEQAIRQYIEGYRKHPERISAAEAKVRMKMVAEVFHKEAPWK